MKGVNKVILVGHLGADPDSKTTDSGSMVTTASLATSDKFKNKDGELEQRTEWHKLTFFGRNAEIAEQYLQKGSLVCVEGSIRTNKYSDKDGNDRKFINIVVFQLYMLSNKGDSENVSSEKVKSDSRSYAKASGRGAKEDWEKVYKPEFDDDIPF